MMLGQSAVKMTNLSETHRISASPGRLLARKIWLPKLIYSALPTFYVVAGVSALLATIYISAWFWLLPYYLLFSVACIHMGILVYRRRHRR